MNHHMRPFPILSLALLLVGCMHRESRTSRVHDVTSTPQIYSAAYGSPSDQPVVFVHGGPGHNSFDFELTTARNLAKRGFYVIVYDQRGQGRSTPPARRTHSQNDPAKIYPDMDLSAFTYRQYAEDLLSVIRKYVPKTNPKKPVLIGHSHGGPIAIQFHDFFRGEVKGIVLVAAPVNFWSVLNSMNRNCDGNMDAEAFQHLSEIAARDITPEEHWNSDEAHKTVASVATVFQTAMQTCRLYEPTRLEQGARELWTSDPEGTIQRPREDIFDTWSMPGFIARELYFSRNHSDIVRKNKGKFFGIYADAEGLFDAGSRGNIEALVNDPGISRFVTIAGASHNVYWQTQSDFIDALESHIARMD